MTAPGSPPPAPRQPVPPPVAAHPGAAGTPSIPVAPDGERIGGHPRVGTPPTEAPPSWPAAGERDDVASSSFPAAGQEGGAPPAAWPAAPETAGWPEPRRRAAVFSRADLLAGAGVLVLVALLGLPLAWIWSRLAPPQISLVLADRTLVALPPESQHRFDDLAIFVLIGVAAGVLSGVAVWLLRGRRGPLVLLALAAGSLAAAWLALRTGVMFADGRYAGAVRAAGPDAVVSAAPRLESAWALIAQPLAAVLTYGVATAVNGLDDLGRHLT